MTRMQDPTKAGELAQWTDQIADTFKVLSLDGACFRRWAKLLWFEVRVLNPFK